MRELDRELHQYETYKEFENEQDKEEKLVEKMQVSDKFALTNAAEGVAET